jgi:hypothetical protein
MTNTILPVSRYQIDHRGSHTTTQPSDRDGVDGVHEVDGVHGDLRSEAKCTGKIPFQEGQQGEGLAAIPVRCRLAAASPHFHVGFRSIWPIEIWYGEELAE